MSISEKLAWEAIKLAANNPIHETISIQSTVNRNNPNVPHRTWRIDLGGAFSSGWVFAEAKSFEMAVLKCLRKIK